MNVIFSFIDLHTVGVGGIVISDRSPPPNIGDAQELLTDDNDITGVLKTYTT